MPYATWLVENDRFEEAQDGMSSLSQQRFQILHEFSMYLHAIDICTTPTKYM